MPQESQVLRCFSCNMFQAQLIKKEKKWQCKVCNSKQSVKYIYGKGSGKDCRVHVMKLNELQFSGCSTDMYIVDDLTGHDRSCDKTNENLLPQSTEKTKCKSKWSAFLDEAEMEKESEDNLFEVGFDMGEITDFYRKRKRIERDNSGLSKTEKILKLSESSEPLKKVEKEIESGIISRASSDQDVREELRRKQDLSSCKSSSSRKGSKWSAFVDDEPGEGAMEEVSESLENWKTDPSSNEMNPLEKVTTYQEPLGSRLHEQNTQNESLVEGKYAGCTVSDDFKESQVLQCMRRRRERLSIFQTPLNNEELDEILRFQI